MAYLNDTDYKNLIRDDRLDQLTDQDASIRTAAEDDAMAVVKDALSAVYDIDAEFTKVGANRNNQVVRWCKNLALYYMYCRVPDDMIPESIVKNYDDTRDDLKDVEDGKKQITLARKTEVDVDGNTVELTKVRWGSQPARSH